MRIHTYERLWVAGAIESIVGFVATAACGPVGLDITMVDNQGETMGPGELESLADVGLRPIAADPALAGPGR